MAAPRSSTTSSETLERQQRRRYDEREQRVARRGHRRVEEATSIDEALDASYDAGARSVKRANEESRAANRRRGYAAGRADAQRAARASSSPPAPSSSSSSSTRQYRAPNTNLPVPTGGVDRVTSSRIILVCVGLSAIGVVAHDAITQPAPTKLSATSSNGTTITVPGHLRSLGGVLIVGTIALVVNEFQPQFGLALGLLLLLDVGVNVFAGRHGVAARVGAGLTGKGSTTSSSSSSSKGGKKP